MQSFQQVETGVCVNCSKSYPLGKIDLHQAYCRKNIKKCPFCFQMYDINDQEGHDKQFHSKKECKFCAQLFPLKQWDTHQPSCKRRPLRCTYCQNDVAYEQIIKHENACGSRTTSCQVCEKFIPLRQIDIHKLTCIIKQPSYRSQQRGISPQNLIHNVRNLPVRLQRIRSDEERRFQGYQGYDNSRQYQRYNEPRTIIQRGGQRARVLSNEKPNLPLNKNLVGNFHVHQHHTNIKPSHIIEPQRVREMIDPVPISIRLAMRKIPNKMPLQNRN